MTLAVRAYVGIEVAKQRNAMAIADADRGGEVRFFGEVDATDESMRRIIRKIASRHADPHFCYGAGSTDYGLDRLITSMGYSCSVINGR
ncbi:transposase IS116 [Mesorhizobium sp. LSHC420B00]|nr:transposase IS116 [Mesorhizobium sp. LSHC420B00]